jgi:DNA-binding beta-propeller fold protein YncE
VQPVWLSRRAGRLSAFDFKTGAKIKDVQTGKACEGVGVTPDATRALVPHANASSLVVGNVATQTLVKSTPLGLTKVEKPSTAGVFPHPDNRHAFVTVRNDNSMLVLDLVAGATLARVEVQSSPDGVTWSPVER